MTSQEKTPRVRSKELERLRTGCSSRKKTTAHSAAHPAASPHRIGKSSSATFPSTVTRRTRRSSACSVAPASPQPARSADTNSSRTVYAKVSMTIGAETHHLARRHRTARHPHLKQARRGREGSAAGCAAGASTSPRTLTRTSARMAWPSSRHTGPISPCRMSEMGQDKEKPLQNGSRLWTIQDEFKINTYNLENFTCRYDCNVICLPKHKDIKVISPFPPFVTSSAF